MSKGKAMVKAAGPRSIRIVRTIRLCALCRVSMTAAQATKRVGGAIVHDYCADEIGA